MTWYNKMKMFAVVCLVMGASAAPAQAQKGFQNTAEVQKLRMDVARLRADLDAALREIDALKAAAGGKVAPEEGPRYRGRSAKSWLEQLKDLEPKTRIAALEALGALAEKDKKLIPVLLDSAKNDKGHAGRTGFVQGAAVRALGKAGPEALPALIELVKDNNDVRYEAVEQIARLGPKAKSAVPVLAKALEEEPYANPMRNTVNALRAIGPAAKEAIPALVKALGKCLEDIGKPENRPGGSRFGVSQNSLNVLVVETLSQLDPALSRDVKLPIIENEGPRYREATPEQQEEWRALQVVLVKRYAKPK